MNRLFIINSKCLSVSALCLLLCLCTFIVQAQNVEKTISLKKNTIPEIISGMTLEEKAYMVIGNKNNYWSENGFLGVGATYQCDRLGIPPVIMDDGPAGLRIPPYRKDSTRTYYCTAFPTATALAASWNTELNEQVGRCMGNEALEYGSDILLTPAVNIHRNPLCGRNFEYYSEDPLLAGKMGAAMIRGVQANGVGSSLKHFAVNNQETNRRNVNAVVSQRALRELYLRPFEIAVKEANPWTVMAAYNKINGYYATENKELLTTVLRDEWGYDGVVVSDWTNADDGVAQMRAGTDLIMPGFLIDYPAGPYFFDDIVQGVKDHALDERILDKRVERVLELCKKTPRFRGYKPSDNPDLDEHATFAKHVAEECMVLLKNENKALPLSKNIKKIALFGKTSYDFIAGGWGSGEVNYRRSMSLCEGLECVGYEVSHTLADYYRVQIDSIVRARGEEDTSKDIEDDRKYIVPSTPELELSPEFISQQAEITDVAVITIGRVSGENGDQNEQGYFTLVPTEQALISTVCKEYHKRRKKVIVVLNIGSVIETYSWKELPDAILLAFQAGQEGAGAVGRIVKGEANPSGKLPMSYPVRYSDTPSAPYFPGIPKYDPVNTYYNEGIYVGYRYYSTFDKPVSFAFGHGLSYTEFEYANLKVSPSRKQDKVEVSVDIRNVGNKPGKEIAQLYLTAPHVSMDKPAFELKGFGKTRELQPGESQTLHFTLDLRALASFESGISAWVAEAGDYIVHVGASSADFRQEGCFRLDCRRIVEPVNDVLFPNLPVKDVFSGSGKLLKGRSPLNKNPYYMGAKSSLWRE